MNRDEDHDVALRTSLSVAVPIWIRQYRGVCWREAARRAQVCANAVGSKGDVLLHRSDKAGRTAEVFNRFAEGIAIAAYQPGGITVFGMHFEVGEPLPDPAPDCSTWWCNPGSCRAEMLGRARQVDVA